MLLVATRKICTYYYTYGSGVRAVAGVISTFVPLRTTIRIFTVFSISCIPLVGIRATGYSALSYSYLWKGVCSFPRVF